jgi:hypothetical protein
VGADEIVNGGELGLKGTAEVAKQYQRQNKG